MTEICFATNNEKKIQEVWPLLQPDFRILSLRDIHCNEELPETQDTIAGNSQQKAEYVWMHYNIACFADDTGLEVDALDGEPGVYSARYAGEPRNADDNINLLLQKLEGKTNLKAQFRTVITLVGLGPVQTFEGIVRGEISRERRGTAGFGYDPIFKPEGFDRTFAEMSLEEKNTMSHRGQAIRKLIGFLKQLQQK